MNTSNNSNNKPEEQDQQAESQETQYKKTLARLRIVAMMRRKLDLMQEIMKQDMPIQNEKAVRLVDYLIRLASLRSKIIRDLDEYEQVLWLNEMPREKGCFTQAWGPSEEYEQDVWLEIQTSPEPQLQNKPDICSDWVNRDTFQKTSDIPELHKTMTKQIRNPAWKENGDQLEFISQTYYLDKYPKVQESWDRYIQQLWKPWAEQHEKWNKIHRIYSKLFTIYNEQLRLGEEYELVLALGLLTWQTPSHQRVRRHLVVANAILEFEARLGKFTIRPNPDGANLRPELDMLDVAEQPARSEESAKASLKNVSDNPWDREGIESVLKALVHAINPNGEYYPHLDIEKSMISEKPIVEYTPAIILRKRSVRGLTEVLKRIKERIKNGEEVPPEFCDLAEILQQEKVASDSIDEDSEVFADGEIWFPKPSNEEQRRIIGKLQNANSVLVQGPPGTGKSHTIANLICHFLATGQRTLITAKTPRALQVLERLLPEELSHLCINLLGSGLDEKRSLEASINAILQKNVQWDESKAKFEIQKHEENLHRLRQEQAVNEKRLRGIRESETHTQNIANGAYCGTAAQIAIAVRKDEARYNWFTDKVSFNKDYPFSDVNFVRLLTELRRLTPEMKQELMRLRPKLFPSIEDFKAIVDNEIQTAERERRTSNNIDEQFFKQISCLPRETVFLYRSHLMGLLKEIKRMRSLPYDWICDAVRDVLSGKGAIWEKLHEESGQSIDNILNIVEKADSIEVKLIRTQNQKRVLEDALILKEHLANGGRLGWGLFRPKVVKSVQYLFNSVLLNGRPCTNFKLICDLVDVLSVKIEMERVWNFWIGRSEITKGPYSLQLQTIRSQLKALSETIAIGDNISKCKEAVAKYSDLQEPFWNDESCLEVMVKTCDHALAKEEACRSRGEIEKLESNLSTLSAKVNAHPVSKELLQAVRIRNIEEYSRLYAKIKDLESLGEKAQWVEKELKQVEQFAPCLEKELWANSVDTQWDERLRLLPEAWRWAQARTWLEDYIDKEDAPSLSRRQRQIEDDIGKTIAHIASLRAWSFCFSRMKEEHRRHMEAWQQSMRRLGKGTGKHAPRHRREAQKHLNECREAVPAWVMPLHRVWDTVEPAPAMFDVIVVDEASQCGFEALPLLYLAKRILIVGDDKQISPDAVGIPRNAVHRLMGDYLYDFNFKSTFDVDASLFDQGRLRYGTRRIVLREHFRCMPEIIRFSNDLCYPDTPLIPLRQYPPDRLAPLVHVMVEGGYREGTDSRVINKPEAEAIVNKVTELCSDKRYDNKTMGIVILQGEAQAHLIEEKLLERVGAEEMEKRRLICGNPYSFQGDERDIMFLSMVAAPNERIGPLTMSADERRFNVAASRARDQMWLFHSVTCDDLSVLCLRRRLLEFFQDTKPNAIAGINIEEFKLKSEQANRSIEKPPHPFDSWFEVDVALEIADRNYHVVPQFEVAGKRIDLVIEGGHARVAIECDGDEFHGAEQYEQDMQRQRMLERCGWVFYRVRASSFYTDKCKALTDLWKMLDERGIIPQRGKSSNFDEQPLSNIPQESGKGISNSIEECRVEEHRVEIDNSRIEVGDTVIYVDEKNPGIEKQALITTECSNPEWGTINFKTPIAQTLLGACTDDIVEAKLPMGIRILHIKKIIKGRS